MTVRVVCRNGHRFNAEDLPVGLQSKCPECGVAVTVSAVETSASGLIVQAMKPNFISRQIPMILVFWSMQKAHQAPR